MLFHSQLFILFFLPIAWSVWRLLDRQNPAREWWLIFSSFVFFGWWDWRFLPLLAGSITLNWQLGHFIHSRTKGYSSLVWLIIGIAFNLVLLGGFKYLGFARDVMNDLGVVGLPMVNIILPIGISFYTFQQISFLIDRKRGIAPNYEFRKYALFVSFFPQLIAGPIVRHNELIPQFYQSLETQERNRRLGQGFIFFIFGLIKKIAIADQLAPYADAVFAHAGHGIPTLTQAWLGLLSFSYQIYFDFSAYSDMAIGLALMFGLRLPINFNAPYRASSMRMFWRRWHITLSHFFRDYLYIPLGGNRRGVVREILALAITMGLCGLWHGAGWPFILWGLWHGAGLSVNRLWGLAGRPIPPVLAWGVTGFFVLLGWVLFRSPDMATFINFYTGLFSLAGTPAGLEAGANVLALCVATIVVLALPTSQDVVFKHFKPRKAYAIVLGLVLAALVLELGKGQPVEFIYFQF